MTEADYGDKAALDRFADDVDVITYEFENVPAETATFLAARKPVLPDPQVLAITQDRLAEKDFVVSLGIADRALSPRRAPRRAGRRSPRSACRPCSRPARFGYDGKGQATLRAGDDPADAVARGRRRSRRSSRRSSTFEREISVVAARGRDGRIACFEVTENEHRNHILKVSRASPQVTPAARRGAAHRRRIADAVDYVGVLAVEMFVVRRRRRPRRARQRDRAAGAQLRPLDARRLLGRRSSSSTSAPSSAGRWRSRCATGRAEMINLIGDEVAAIASGCETPGACVHLYGKQAMPPRPQDGPRHPRLSARLTGTSRLTHIAAAPPAPDLHERRAV